MIKRIVVSIFTLFPFVCLLFGQSNAICIDEWVLKEDSIKSNHNSFGILLIVNGKYSHIEKLYTYKNDTKEECHILKECLGMLYMSKEDYMNIRTSDSITIQFRYPVSMSSDIMLSFSLSNYLYYSSGGPIVYVYTSDDKKNKKMLKKRKGYIDYYVFAEYHNYATTGMHAIYSKEYEW